MCIYFWQETRQSHCGLSREKESEDEDNVEEESEDEDNVEEESEDEDK